jgi:hypothetical protein
MIHLMNLNQHCLYHGLLNSSGTHLNRFTIRAMVGRRIVHFGITDDEKNVARRRVAAEQTTIICFVVAISAVAEN